MTTSAVLGLAILGVALIIIGMFQKKDGHWVLNLVSGIALIGIAGVVHVLSTVLNQ